MALVSPMGANQVVGGPNTGSSTWASVEPYELLAVSTYVASAAGVTVVPVPLTVPIVLMLRLVASVTDQFKLAVCPVVTQEGLAVNLAITGAWPAGGGGELLPPPPQPTASSPQVTAIATLAGFDILMKELRLTALPKACTDASASSR